MAVLMELSRILIRELSDYQLIELREADGDRSFPIVIGLPEAQAIERRLKGIEIKRPQTHDLLAAVIDELGGKLLSITINDLSEHTFFASLDVRTAKGETVDQRYNRHIEILNVGKNLIVVGCDFGNAFGRIAFKFSNICPGHEGPRTAADNQGIDRFSLQGPFVFDFPYGFCKLGEQVSVQGIQGIHAFQHDSADPGRNMDIQIVLIVRISRMESFPEKRIFKIADTAILPVGLH